VFYTSNDTCDLYGDILLLVAKIRHDSIILQSVLQQTHSL
jgi:hypothetical protein